MSGRMIMDQDSSGFDSMSYRNTKLLNCYKDLNPGDEIQVLDKFLKSLTFDMVFSTENPELNKYDVFLMKEAIDRLYEHYRNKKCRLCQVEGLWPLLTFCTSKTSGFELYLAFEKLLEPLPIQAIKDAQSIVKEEHFDFQADKFFQNDNIWMEDHNFMKALRVFQRNLKKTFSESLIDCKKLLRVMIKDEIQQMIQCRDLQDRYQEYKHQFKKIALHKKMLKNARALSLFRDQIMMSNLVGSDPGDMNHVLQFFSKEEFLLHQSYQHDEVKKTIHIAENRCLSAINLENDRSQSQNSICSQNNIKQTSVRSFSTKKRIQSILQHSVSPKQTLPKDNKKVVKRPVRYQFIGKLYDLEPTKKQLYEEIMQTKNNQNKIRDKVIIADKNLKTRLRKINKESYSDEQVQNKRKTRMVEDKQVNRMFQELSFNRERRLSQSSEQITMRRHRPTKVRAIQVNNVRIDEQGSENLDKKRKSNQFINMSERDFSIQDHSSRKWGQKQPVSDDLLRLKQAPELHFIKASMTNVEERPKEDFSFLEMRRLKIEENEDILSDLDIHEYLSYLNMLEPKEIKKQILSVSKQLLSRQYKIADTEMILKILSLLIMSENSDTSHSNSWISFRVSHIEPMLQHCFCVNIYSCLSDILNNLSVSENNDDTFLLGNIKKWFKFIIEISRSFFQNSKIETIVIQIIYKQLSLPSIIESFFEPETTLYSSFLNLKNPFKIGTDKLKFKFDSKDNIIAFVIASFIFEEILIDKLGISRLLLENISDKYKSNLIKELETISPKVFENKQFYRLTAALRQFYDSYKPYLDDKFFINLIKLFNLSLDKLNTYSQLSIRVDSEIKQHLQFIEAFCGDYISQTVCHTKINPQILMSRIIIRTGIAEKYREIKPNNKLKMTLYPRLLSIFWKHKTLRDPSLFKNTISTYVEKVKNTFDFEGLKGQNILILKDLIVAESIFKFIEVAYRSNIFDTFENDFRFKINRYQRGIQRFISGSDFLGQIRQVIVLVFADLMKKFDSEIEFYRQNKKKDQQWRSIQRFDSITQTLINFFSIFFYPISGISEVCENSVLKHSISHFMFILQFVLHHNSFLRFFKIKLPFQSRLFTKLLKKCEEILIVLFSSPPNFSYQLEQIQQFLGKNQDILCLSQNKNRSQELNKQYYTIIQQFTAIRLNPSEENKMKRQIEIVVLKELSSKKYLQTIGNTVGMYLIANLSMQQNLYQNSITKIVVQSANINTITSQKIQKSIMLLNCIFRLLKDFLANKSANQKEKMKKQFFTNFLQKIIKEFAIVLSIGFALKNKHEYEGLPINQIQFFLKDLDILSQKIIANNKQAGYLHFFYAFQELQGQIFLDSIFNKLIELFGNQKKELGPSLSSFLLELQRPMKKIQVLQNDSHIIIECVKILTFVLKWEEINPECIKKYIQEMQLVSQRQSFIIRIELTAQNIHTILQLFDAIFNRQQNFYEMKSIISTYAELICAQGKEINPDKYFKRIAKLLICLSEIIRKEDQLRSTSEILIQKVLDRFIGPCFEAQAMNLPNISRRFTTFFEMLRMSGKQRKIYENMVINKRQQIRRWIDRLNRIGSSKERKVFPYKTFEEMVEECMINEYSDFLEVRKLIEAMMNQNVLTTEMNHYFRRLLSNYIQKLSHPRGNAYCIEWAKEKIDKMDEKDRKTKEILEWMDCQ